MVITSKNIKIIAVLFLASVFVVIILGFHTETLSSRYAETSYNYGKDRASDLYFYQVKVGNFAQGPHRAMHSERDDILLRLEYRSGPDNNSIEKITEITALGFLVPFLPYRYVLILSIILFCVIYCSPIRNVCMRGATYLLVNTYGLFFIILGIAGVILLPKKALSDIANASFGGIILFPIFAGMWITYFLSAVFGILILLRKYFAVICSIILQFTFFFSLPYLLGIVLKPGGWKSAGYRIEILNGIFHLSVVIIAALITIWFFTGHETKRYFLRKNLRQPNPTDRNLPQF